MTKNKYYTFLIFVLIIAIMVATATPLCLDWRGKNYKYSLEDIYYKQSGSELTLAVKSERVKFYKNNQVFLAHFTKDKKLIYTEDEIKELAKQSLPAFNYANHNDTIDLDDSLTPKGLEGVTSPKYYSFIAASGQIEYLDSMSKLNSVK